MTDDKDELHEPMAKLREEIDQALGETDTETIDALVETMFGANLLDRAQRVADVALLFGETMRATQHPDGRPESDTTHTVMLGMLVVELAPEGCDLGKLLAMVLVHDLPEYHPDVKDTCTAWGLSDSEKAEKAARERWGVEQLRELGLERIVALIEEYETQVSPEARWVRYVDKVCPKLTHLRNGGSALRAIGMTFADMISKHAEQGAELRAMYPEQDQARELFAAACRRCEAELLQDGEPIGYVAGEVERNEDGTTTCDVVIQLGERDSPMVRERAAIDFPNTARGREAAKIIEELNAGAELELTDVMRRLGATDPNDVFSELRSRAEEPGSNDWGLEHARAIVSNALGGFPDFDGFAESLRERASFLRQLHRENSADARDVANG